MLAITSFSISSASELKVFVSLTTFGDVHSIRSVGVNLQNDLEHRMIGMLQFNYHNCNNSRIAKIGTIVSRDIVTSMITVTKISLAFENSVLFELCIC